MDKDLRTILVDQAYYSTTSKSLTCYNKLNNRFKPNNNHCLASCKFTLRIKMKHKVLIKILKRPKILLKVVNP